MRLSKQTDGKVVLEVRVRKVVEESGVVDTIHSVMQELQEGLERLVEIYSETWFETGGYTDIAVTGTRISINKKLAGEADETSKEE